MIYVFDLDDTLYEEITFVRSGFFHVAKYLSEQYGLDHQVLYKEFCEEEILNGRGRIFDNVLLKFNLKGKDLVKKCITSYRLHRPDIALYSDADACLKRLQQSNSSVYIITDGNKIVQQNKLSVLQLRRYVRFAFITNRYGLANNKPSPYCFLKICEREKCAPEKVVYIGDNPKKDFVGIKPLGFQTIRIMRGNFKHLMLEEQYEADRSIGSLNEI